MVLGNRSHSIKLQPGQSFKLFGLFPRKQIDWNTIQNTPSLTMEALLNADVEPRQLKQLQPSLLTWVTSEKISHKNLAELCDWQINIPEEYPAFTFLDCVKTAQHASPQRMIDLGLDLKTLMSKYNMTLQNLDLFKYSLRDWFVLGLNFEDHFKNIDDFQCQHLFKISIPELCHEWNTHKKMQQ